MLAGEEVRYHLLLVQPTWTTIAVAPPPPLPVVESGEQPGRALAHTASAPATSQALGAPPAQATVTTWRVQDLAGLLTPAETNKATGDVPGNGAAAAAAAVGEAPDAAEGGGAQLPQDRVLHGVLLIPCRAALRGAFPLNGTYFQARH